MNMIARTIFLLIALLTIILASTIPIAANQPTQEPYQKILTPGACFTYVYGVYGNLLKLLANPGLAEKATKINGKLEYIPCSNCGFVYVRKAWIKWCVIKRDGNWIWINATQVIIAANGSKYINKATYKVNLETLATFYRGKWVGTWPFLAWVKVQAYIIAKNDEGAPVEACYGVTIATSLPLSEVRAIVASIFGSQVAKNLTKWCTITKHELKCNIEMRCGFYSAILRLYPRYPYRVGSVYIPSYRVAIAKPMFLSMIRARYPKIYRGIVSILNSSSLHIYSLALLNKTAALIVHILRYRDTPCSECFPLTAAVIDYSTGLTLAISTAIDPMPIPLEHIYTAPGIENVVLILNNTNVKLYGSSSSIGANHSLTYLAEVAIAIAIAVVTAVAVARRWGKA